MLTKSYRCKAQIGNLTIKTKMNILIVSFVFVFAMILAGCEEYYKPKQASKNAAEVKVKMPEKAAESQEASTAGKKLKADFIYVEFVAKSEFLANYGSSRPVTEMRCDLHHQFRLHR